MAILVVVVMVCVSVQHQFHQKWRANEFNCPLTSKTSMRLMHLLAPKRASETERETVCDFLLLQTRVTGAVVGSRTAWGVKSSLREGVGSQLKLDLT